MKRIGTIYEYNIYQLKLGQWAYDIFIFSTKELIARTNERFYSELRCERAAIGHICSIENGVSHD